MPNCRAALPLNDEQKAIAAPVLDTFENLCLMSGRYQGKPAAFLCAVDMEGETYHLTPRFIVLTHDMHDACLSADGRPLEAIHAR